MTTTQARPEKKEVWHHTTPVTFSPLFAWPPKPKDILLVLTKRWVTISRNVLFLLMAFVVYDQFLPDQSEMRSLSTTWVLPIFARNLMFMTVVAGGLHLFFYTFQAQGRRLKFDSRPQLEKGGQFSFRKQVWDNAFWSLASGATIWSTYEVLYLWAYANNAVPTFSISQYPFVLVAWLLLLPILLSSHFYFIHRILHWPPLYKRVHAVHHRNIHIGPWSGMSMHPVEHVFYISSVLMHFVIASHPVVVLVHLYSRCLGPAFSHSGFEKLLIKDKAVFDSADFHHQLHHRYFECNYGTVDAPWDAWLNTAHDGSDEATKRTKERRKQMYQQKSIA